MRIALIAEGCYPFVTGGVSTWCDQLVHGLGEHEFEVVAITATSRNTAVIPVPGNVVRVRSIPLWDWAPRRRRPPARSRRVFARLYRRLLSSMLDPASPQREFDLALRAMFDFAQRGDLAAHFHCDEAVDTLMDVWARTQPTVPISVRDALDAAEMVEHMVLPLSAPVPVADICHPVSNGLPALVALMAKWTYGTPIVMSEHGVYLRERYLGCQSVTYSWPVKAVMLAFMRRMCRTAYQEADVIAPVNVFNRRWEVRNGAHPDRVRTVYNGVDAAALPTAPVEPEQLTIGWVGRVDPLKDLHTLVEAFSLVRQRVPDVILRLFGPTPAGNESYEASVRAMVEDCGLTDAVSFEGPISPVSDAYHASTVVALSSVSEGLPYTVMEAMMCARPTVSSDVGGVSEVAGDAGVVVPPRNPEALADALVRLLLDEAGRRDLGERARRRALEMFRLETMLDSFREVYGDLTRPQRAPVVPGPRRQVTDLVVR